MRFKAASPVQEEAVVKPEVTEGGRGRRGLDGQRLGTWAEEGGSGKEERSAADTAILRGREFHPAADGLGRGPENRVLIAEARPPSWPWTQLSCSYWEIQNLNNLQGPF